MRNIAEIQREITEIQSKVQNYKIELIDIEDAIGYIIREKEAIESESLNNVRMYDMTQGNDWRGNLEKEAEHFQGAIIDSLTVAQEECTQLVHDMHSIEQTIQKRIEESLEKISLLEAEMYIDELCS